MIQDGLVTRRNVDRFLETLKTELDRIETQASKGNSDVIQQLWLEDREDVPKLTGCIFIDILERPESPDPTCHVSGFVRVACRELMQFIATATFGAYLEKLSVKKNGHETGNMNILHKALLSWTFQRGFEGIKNGIQLYYMPPNCLNPDLSTQLHYNLKDASINSLGEGGVLCGANGISRDMPVYMMTGSIPLVAPGYE